MTTSHDPVPAAPTVESLADDLDALVTLATTVRYGPPMHDGLGLAVALDKACAYHLLEVPARAIGQALADKMGTVDAAARVAFEVAERRPLSVSHRVDFLVRALQGVILPGAEGPVEASE